MADKHDWIWHELMTTDAEAAAKFYGDVVGWRIEKYPGPEAAPLYLVGNAEGRGVVGIMNMPPGVPPNMPPNWTGYIYTSDVDATAKEVTGAGGTVLRAPFDIPDVGRVAVVSDPEGGRFNLMQPGRADAPPKLEQNAVGNISWCELHSSDEKNFDFYGKLFGWRKVDSMDMGEHGTYQMFTSNEYPMTGGSLRKMKDSPDAQMPTYWLYYFSVDGLDAAIGRVKQGGGNIFMGPHEVPGGTWIAIGNDPQGAMFALHSQKR